MSSNSPEQGTLPEKKGIISRCWQRIRKHPFQSVLFLALSGSTGYLGSQLYTTKRTNTYLQERIQQCDTAYPKRIKTLEHRVDIWQDLYFKLKTQHQEWRDKERNLDMQLLTTTLENRRIQDELAFYKGQYQQALQLKQQFKDIKQAMDEEELLFLQVYHKQKEYIRTAKLELLHTLQKLYADTIQNYWKKTYGEEKPYKGLSFLEDHLFCDESLVQNPEKFDNICQYFNTFNTDFPQFLPKIINMGIDFQISDKDYLDQNDFGYTVGYQTGDSITVCYVQLLTIFGHECFHVIDKDFQYSGTNTFQKIYQQFIENKGYGLDAYYLSKPSELFVELGNKILPCIKNNDYTLFIQLYGEEAAEYLRWAYNDFHANHPL